MLAFGIAAAVAVNALMWLYLYSLVLAPSGLIAHGALLLHLALAFFAVRFLARDLRLLIHARRVAAPMPEQQLIKRLLAIAVCLAVFKAAIPVALLASFPQKTSQEWSTALARIWK